jgi:capsular exopolysaccharide synthesis family protein
LLAVATAYALDMVDQSVKNIQEAEELFGYTVLGNIPDYRELGIEKAQKKRSERTNEVEFVVARDLPRSPVGEAYRMLKGNLTYFGSDSNVRTISITSSIPGEGKSEVAANLAITLVHLGHRVLLVDADMRRPTQHYKWGLSTQAGLSNVLVGELPLMVATHEVAPNLDVLPAGDTPRDPVQLLESRTIASLMRNFSKCYDYTILDCPPLIGTVDASLLSGLTDGSLLVVRPGVVNYNSAIAAKKHLSKGDFKILGMVLNGVKVQNEPYNYYHYYTREEVDRSLREKQAQF